MVIFLRIFYGKYFAVWNIFRTFAPQIYIKYVKLPNLFNEK